MPQLRWAMDGWSHKKPPVTGFLQSFDSADVQVFVKLQAGLLQGWENPPLTCGP